MLGNWLERSRGAGGIAAAVLLAVFLFGAESALAQQGAIGGQITDAETLEPVPGVQVFVPGTALGALTNEQGRYRIEGVPVGQVTLELRLIGYKRVDQTVTVQAGQLTTADFQVEQTALRLQDIVVTGVVGETPRVKLPFTVDHISSEELPVPASDVGSLLAGKSAGVQVVRSSGRPGSESDILIRGPTSIDNTGRNEGPLVLVDGVVASTGGGLADINSLDIESIEVVKGAAAASLYGARAQYGVINITTKRGENRPAGTFDFIARGEYGVSDLERTLDLRLHHVIQMNESQTAYLVNPDAGGGESLTIPENPFIDPLCPDRCFQDRPFLNPTDNQAQIFEPGDSYSLYGAATGSMQDVSFRASTEFFNEQGVVELKEGFDRINARLNLDAQLFGEVDLAVSGFVSRSESDGDFPFFGLAFISAGVDASRKTIGGQRNAEECTGGAEDNCWFVTEPDPGVARTNPLWEEQVSPGPRSEGKRTMASLNASWSPIPFFSLEGDFSYDRTDNNSFSHTLKGAPTGEGICCDLGALGRNDFVQEAVNAGVTASFNRAFMDQAFTTRTKVRFQVEDQNSEFFSGSGSNIAVQGVTSLGALADPSLQTLSSTDTEIRGQSFFIISSWDYEGRYIVDGLFRREGSSLFGSDERWHNYFRGSAAWRISQEPWFDVPGVDEFKLRYSYGTAGGRPNFFAQYETFDIGGGGQLTFNTLGNQALKPELSKEHEFGGNLVLADRLSLDATYAYQVTEDQLLPVPLPGFFGFGTQWQNAGELEARSLELALRASIVDTREVSWTARFAFDRLRQKITQLDVPPFTYGPDQQGIEILFRAQEGEEIGGFYGTRFMQTCGELEETFGIGQADCDTFFDVNDDGWLVWVGQGNDFMAGPGADGELGTDDDLWGTSGEVGGVTFPFGRPNRAVLVDPLCLEADPTATEEDCRTNFLKLGSSTPDFGLQYANTFRWRGLSLYTLLDAQVGHEIYNLRKHWSMGPEPSGAGATEADQAGKPPGLKKPLSYYNANDNALYNGLVPNNHFVEDGSFLKVREVSLSYSLGDDLLNRLFRGAFERVTLSLIGRNLFTFTDYEGFDPEVGFGQGTGDTRSTGSAALTRADAFEYPNFRRLTGSVEIVF